MEQIKLLEKRLADFMFYSTSINLKSFVKYIYIVIVIILIHDNEVQLRFTAHKLYMFIHPLLQQARLL